MTNGSNIRYQWMVLDESIHWARRKSADKNLVYCYPHHCPSQAVAMPVWPLEISEKEQQAKLSIINSGRLRRWRNNPRRRVYRETIDNQWTVSIGGALGEPRKEERLVLGRRMDCANVGEKQDKSMCEMYLFFHVGARKKTIEVVSMTHQLFFQWFAVNEKTALSKRKIHRSNQEPGSFQPGGNSINELWSLLGKIAPKNERHLCQKIRNRISAFSSSFSVHGMTGECCWLNPRGTDLKSKRKGPSALPVKARRVRSSFSLSWAGSTVPADWINAIRIDLRTTSKFDTLVPVVNHFISVAYVSRDLCGVLSV